MESKKVKFLPRTESGYGGTISSNSFLVATNELFLFPAFLFTFHSCFPKEIIYNDFPLNQDYYYLLFHIFSYHFQNIHTLIKSLPPNRNSFAKYEYPPPKATYKISFKN